jgi:iron transport multicopper oxidase
VPTLLPQIFDKNNTQNRPPIPQAGLVNGADNKVANQTFKFVPGKKYKFRIINTSALAGAILFIDSHKMKVVEIDGVYVKKTEAEQIYVGPAQRYSVIVEALKTKDKNFAFSCVFDVNPNFLKPVVGFPINTTSYLQYDESKPLSGQFIAPAPFKVLDDMTLTVSGRLRQLAIETLTLAAVL